MYTEKKHRDVAQLNKTQLCFFYFTGETPTKMKCGADE